MSANPKSYINKSHTLFLLPPGVGQQAEEAYGVILSKDDQVDAAPTLKLRAAAKEERGAPPPFDFGYTPPERQAAE